MKMRLNESQEELRSDRKEEGLSEDTAPRENLYGIELPIATCSPFNGDFDGDTMAIHLVPDDDAIKEETYARMSPRYVNVYKKNNSPIN